jgi:prefoldin subunit 5
MIDRIRSRRAALAEQMSEWQAQYQELENTIALLRRNLDMAQGAMQELDALLEIAGESNGAGDLAIAGAVVLD